MSIPTTDFRSQGLRCEYCMATWGTLSYALLPYGPNTPSTESLEFRISATSRREPVRLSTSPTMCANTRRVVYCDHGVTPVPPLAPSRRSYMATSYVVRPAT